MARTRTALLLLVISSSQTACIRSHTLKPESAWDAPEVSSTVGEPLLFSVTDGAFFVHGKRTDPSKELHAIFEQLGGQPWIDSATSEWAQRTPWQRLKGATPEEVENEAMSPPGQGLYLRAHLTRINVSMGARHWSKVALITLFVLPAYSGSGGFYADIDIFRDGRKLKSHRYRVLRKQLVWLPLIVAVWVNAFTNSEYDTLEAIARDVMADLARHNYFRTERATPLEWSIKGTPLLRRGFSLARAHGDGVASSRPKPTQRLREVRRQRRGTPHP